MTNAQKKTRRRRFRVGVRKEYFPRKLWPTEFGVSYIEVVTVTATSRTEAATEAWKRHGKEWKALMLPNRRHISLDVNEPTIGVGGNLGRLVPITVEKNS